jgi:hemerythrin-like domain-containing protein
VKLPERAQGGAFTLDAAGRVLVAYLSLAGGKLELMLGQLEAGVPGSLAAFASEVEQQVEDARQHMQLEEKTVIPLAKKYLTTEDWIAIAEAFGEHGDPRFGAKPEHEFRDLFTRIVNLAPPPIGVGPAHD